MLRAEGALRDERLALCDLTARTLAPRALAARHRRARADVVPGRRLARGSVEYEPRATDPERGESCRSGRNRHVKLNGPWHTETIEIDEPHAHEVKVKMAFAGLCHSDEHLRNGDIGTDPPRSLEMISGRDSMFPSIGGHEGSGVVESVGEGVTGSSPATTSRCRFIPSCGKCEYCLSGRQYICDMGGARRRRADDLGRDVASPPR